MLRTSLRHFSGGLIYLLDLFCNGTNPTVRERSAELFSKMMSDKLIGPKVKIVLSKFLPAIFMDAMRDSAEASVHMFEGEMGRSRKDTPLKVVFTLNMRLFLQFCRGRLRHLETFHLFGLISPFNLLALLV